MPRQGFRSAFLIAQLKQIDFSLLLFHLWEAHAWPSGSRQTWFVPCWLNKLICFKSARRSIPWRKTLCSFKTYCLWRQSLGGRNPLVKLIQVWIRSIESHMLPDIVSSFLTGIGSFRTVPNTIRASLGPGGFNRGSRPSAPCRNGPCTHKFRSVLNWEVTRVEAGLVVSQKSYFKCFKLNHNSSCPA